MGTGATSPSTFRSGWRVAATLAVRRVVVEPGGGASAERTMRAISRRAALTGALETRRRRACWGAPAGARIPPGTRPPAAGEHDPAAGAVHRPVRGAAGEATGRARGRRECVRDRPAGEPCWRSCPAGDGGSRLRRSVPGPTISRAARRAVTVAHRNELTCRPWCTCTVVTQRPRATATRPTCCCRRHHRPVAASPDTPTPRWHPRGGRPGLPDRTSTREQPPPRCGTTTTGWTSPDRRSGEGWPACT